MNGRGLADRAFGFLRSSGWPDARLCLAVALGIVLANVWLRVSRLSFADYVNADFVAFYAASLIAFGPDPALVYDAASHLAAERSVQDGRGMVYLHFLYPPTALAFVGALSALPYFVAFGTWVALQFAAMLAALRALGRGWAVAVCCAAFPPGVQAAIMGQNSMLTAALLAAGPFLLAGGRPFLGGVALGLLCYKPHFGLLVPVALIAAREWRAVAGAAIGVGATALVSLAAFGPGPWTAYIGAVADGTLGRTYVPEIIPLYMFASVGQSLTWAGLPVWASWIAQGIASVAAAVLVALVWRDPATRGRAARPASLAAGTMLAMPVLMFYDTLIAVVALAAIAGEARREGWRGKEKWLLCGVFPVMMFWEVIGRELHLPYGPALAATLLAVAWRRRHVPG